MEISPSMELIMSKEIELYHLGLSEKIRNEIDMKTICPKCKTPYSEHSCYWSPCSGCPDGHASFWKTIVESNEWREWEKIAYKKGFDSDESRECGLFSPRHFQAFIKFLRK
jgi:hypothetical protein